ncbi:hypothetical protein P170DRAFT_450923 [Aspergillus steynii IBT 23096]|uniref:UbiA prenyltransferase n=1 Tax=Aspergillus steynii IBT 23096 TaxID=1392250 RepID=A0A2I2FT05_9EURO|nr:uncharacterized protein P170DRAFT_450923 [Aspergillus steynii IBT 23096]PLB43746.1 hypothetical protein P170DRAFT_450923 [Aspergillus steynii IBT 23096]
MTSLTKVRTLAKMRGGISGLLAPASDFKTIILPSTVFGVLNSLATSAYGLDDIPPITLSLILTRLIQALVWVSLVYIPFGINNQRSPSAIVEDAINKPWRPLPQNRLSPSQARRLMYCIVLLAPLHGYIYRGIGFRQSSLLRALDIWYNNVGGADKNPVLRNLLNSLGYLSFITGALEVALGRQIPFTSDPMSTSGPENRLALWLLIIGGIVFSTIHLQDLYDQEGDASRGRRTVPLVIGDAPARWTIATPMLFWGIVCPRFWRVMIARGVESDRETFRLWNCWISAVYAMPFFAQM